MSQEIIKHLEALGKLTNNPKYYVDIADLLSTQPYIDYKDQAVNLYLQCLTAKELSTRDYADSYVKAKVDTILNRKVLPLDECKENSLSVIIPTLWKADEAYFKHNLSVLESNPNVLEVLIHDNDPTSRFNFDWIHYPKVRVIEDCNRYVNPAWEHSVKQAKGEFFLLLNDDCLIDHLILDSTITVLTEDNSVGLVVFNTGNDDIRDFYNIYIEAVKYVTHTQRGNYFWYAAGRVNEFPNIPEGLNIFYGDDWIRLKCRESGKRMVQVISSSVSHALSQTVNSLDLYRKGILESEGEIYRRAIGG